MSSFLARLRAFFGDPHGYRLAGTDLSGNKYFESTTRVNGKLKRKVEMNYNVAKALQTPQFLRMQYDPGQIPVLWEQWLRYTRKTAPTLADLQRDADRMRVLRERVSVLEAADRLDRVKTVERLRKENSDAGHFSTTNNVTQRPSVHAALGGPPIADEWKPQTTPRRGGNDNTNSTGSPSSPSSPPSPPSGA